VIPIVIIALTVILLIPTNVFAAETVYWVTEAPRFSNQPVVCIYEPNEPKATDVIKGLWVKETEIGIKSWEIALKNTETRDSDKWDIHIEKISLEKENTFDNSICRVEVRFTGTPLEESPNAVGWETHDGSKSQINLFYITPEICGYTFYSEYDRSFPDWCFDDTFHRSKAIGNIAAHEFGHSIGLGHYQSSDPEINLEWSIDPVASPSIMTLAVHYDETKNPIRKIDTDKVKEIYGYNGFGKYEPVKISQPEPEPLPEPVSSGTAILQVEPNKTIQTKILGTVPDRLYSRGHPVELQITNPDGTKESAAIMATKRGHFEYIVQFNSQSQIGNYDVLFIYKDEIIQKNSIEVVKAEFSNLDTKSITKSQIPEWIKNNVRWWAEGQIDDGTFIQGIQFLIKEGVMTIPSTEQKTVGASNEIPSWIRNNAKWWVEDLISEDDFVQGIQFLVKNGIIQVEQTLVTTP